MADAFLSYAREDLSFVRRLTAALQTRNREVWVDLDDVMPSARWREEIRTGITAADAVIFVITPDSVASEVCREELDYATEAPKRIVPIIARQTPTASVPRTLAELNWLSFLEGTDFEADVDRLVEILNTDIDRVHLHTKLLTRTREWENRGRDRSLLLRGGELKEAETWLADHTSRKPAASSAQIELILASRYAATRRQRGVGLAGVAVAVVLAVVATVAVIQRQAAQEQRLANTARQLMVQAGAIQDSDPSAALLLGIAAERIHPDSQTRASLIGTLTATHDTHVLTGQADSVDFSPDSRTLATTSSEHAVTLWDLTDRTHPKTLGPPLTVKADSVNFSPDSRTLATTSSEHAVTLWDLTDRTRPTRLGPPLTGYTATSLFGFSFDGRFLITTASDKAVIFWDLTDRTRPTSLSISLTREFTLPAGSVALSFDGRLLATADPVGGVVLLDLSNRTRPTRLGPPLTGTTGPVAFSTDGRTLATTSSDDPTVTLWDVIDRTRPIRLSPLLTDYTSPVYSVAFSTDGSTLATGSINANNNEQMVILWDLTDRSRPTPLGPPLSMAGSTGPVDSVAFSTDGRTLATGGATVILWDLTDRTRPTPLGPPLTGTTGPVAFSTDGRTLATGGATVILWDLADRSRPTPLGPPLSMAGSTGPVDSVAFSTDGRTLATGGATVILWDLTDRTRPTPLGPPLTGTTGPVAFSTDGRTLAANSSEQGEQTVILWDLTDRTFPASLGSALTETPTSVDVSPDGRTLATSSQQGSVLWDITDLNYLRDHATERACSITGRGLNRDEWALHIHGLAYQDTCSG